MVSNGLLWQLFRCRAGCSPIQGNKAEKRFLAFQNKGSFWYLSSIFRKQTLLVAMNKTSNKGNILRRRTGDIKPCTLGEVLF